MDLAEDETSGKAGQSSGRGNVGHGLGDCRGVQGIRRYSRCGKVFRLNEDTIILFVSDVSVDGGRLQVSGVAIVCVRFSIHGRGDFDVDWLRIGRARFPRQRFQSQCRLHA